jgi:hypothetical protein
MTATPTNPLTQLLERIESKRGPLLPGAGVTVEIPITVAYDLMGMNMDQWRTGSNGTMEDSTIDALLAQITVSGAAALDGIHVRGAMLQVSKDLSQMDIQIQG